MLRYVDDVLMLSALLCGACLCSALRAMMPIAFDIEQCGTQAVWTDISLSINEHGTVSIRHHAK
eukprot:1276286-Lingulodinium_polyedra.AAC.1